MTSGLLCDERHALTDQDFRDASEQLLFVFPELRESLRNTNSFSFLDSSTTTAHNSSIQMDRHSGVLWKRRDVFKNRWRPRWFALNPGQGILTYYLLNAHATPSSSPMTAFPTAPSSNGGERNDTTTDTAASSPRSTTTATPRNRSTSWDSQVSAVSESSLDYDVVPRGTIFLLGCTVQINELLSKPSENLYAFTIRPPPSSTDSRVHLAARTVQAREVWVQKLQLVCHRQPHRRHYHPSSSLPTHLQSPSSILYQQQHSIPEDAVLEQPNSVTAMPTTWTTLGPTERLYQDLPESIVTKIQDKITTFLPMCQADLSNPPWKMILQTATLSASQTTDSHGRAIIQSRKQFDNTIPPMHIFSLLIDISRRHLYEHNVQADVRIKILNDHTFLDYYSYKAVRFYRV